MYIKLLNKYHQKKKSFEKKARERCQNICEEEKEKRQRKRPKTDLKVFLKKKKEKASVSS